MGMGHKTATIFFMAFSCVVQVDACFVYPVCDKNKRKSYQRGTFMNKWQRRFFDLARLVATWSKDPSSQVGAVIVDDKKRIVSVGFNGLPMGVEDTAERLNTRELKYELIVHAEANAILTAPKSVSGCTIYVYPYLPCSRCAGAIIQSGIKRVVVEDRPIPDRWLENFTLAKTILTEAGVEVQIIPPDKDEKQ